MGVARYLYENWKQDLWFGGLVELLRMQVTRLGAGSCFQSSFGVCILIGNEKNKPVVLSPGHQLPAFSYCFSAT